MLNAYMKKILKEEAILRLREYNPNINLVGEYVGYLNKTYFKCEKCKNIKITSFNSILNSCRRNGCLKCEKRTKNRKRSRSKSHEKYISEVYDIWGNSIKVIGKYDNGSKKIDVVCGVCGCKWSPEAKSLLYKHGCPKCGHKKNRLSTVKKHSVYIEEVKKIHHGRIDVVGKYASNKNKILLKCNKCQHEWSAVARNIIKGRGCPKCNLNKGETLINSILEKLNLNFKFQYVIENLKTENNGTPIFDFVIFKNGVLSTIIEYDGIQHFKVINNWGGKNRFINQQKIDKFKNDYCDINKIKMIRIKYTELNKINVEYIKQKLNEK